MMKSLLKSLAYSAMATGGLLIIWGWLADPAISMTKVLKIKYLNLFLMQSDFLLWGGLIYATGFVLKTCQDEMYA